MKRRDAGQDDVRALQNRFTAYLQTAVKRKKRDYSRKQIHLASREISRDLQNAPCSIYCTGSDWPRHLPEPENVALLTALSQLTIRERYILFEKVLNGTGYDKLAERLGLQYSGVASAYHRVIQKLRRALKEGQA